VVHKEQDLYAEGQENQIDYQQVGPVTNLFRTTKIEIEQGQKAEQQTCPVLGALVLPGHPVFGPMSFSLGIAAFDTGASVRRAVFGIDLRHVVPSYDCFLRLRALYSLALLKLMASS
jgi:hypothetical protein